MTTFKVRVKKYDLTLLVVLMLLILAGLVILYSTSVYNGEVKFHDAMYYLKKQLFATALGLAVMYLVAGIDYHIWKYAAVAGYVGAVALSVLVLLAGEEYNGSKRWLSLGPFSFQPSEYAKVALILFLAWMVNKNAKKISLKLKRVKGAIKYKVQIAKDKKFKKIIVTKTTKKLAYSVLNGKFKKTKKLYARAKAIIVKEKKIYQGKWSNPKLVKIKK